MRTCPECGVELQDDAEACTLCGTTLNASPADGSDPADGDPPSGSAGAVRQPEPTAEADFASDRERFERRYGIDIGDRTADEFLENLDRRDYSPNAWFWLVVAAEVVGAGLFWVGLFGPGGFGGLVSQLFLASNGVLALGVFGDTRAVGRVGQWATIRWTYVVLAAVPFVGHIAGLLYLVMRRLNHEQTVEHRRRLLSEGVELGPRPSGD